MDTSLELISGEQVRENNLRSVRYWIQYYANKIKEQREYQKRYSVNHGLLIGKFRSQMAKYISEYIDILTEDYSRYDRLREYRMCLSQ